MPTPAELAALLARPNETLTVEYKSWLRLTENSGKATLAKAAIALANHGGGTIVLGMRGDNAQGGALASQPRPETLGRYSQDDVNAAVNRYASPRFHCELAFANHPETGTEHAFVLVPGGMTVPVMSTRECVGVIQAQRCYMRKPGPRSEEPFTAEEWRELLDRCVRAGRETMLEAIRLIVQGHAGRAPEPEVGAQLDQFVTYARNRWRGLVEPLEANDVARMPFGHFEFAFEILDVAAAPTLAELRRRIDEAARVRHTGWPPFVSLDRAEFAPHVADGMIETWLGADVERQLRDPAHCDFWRASPAGRLFLQRGYQEDVEDARGRTPGTLFGATLPIWRVGEAALYVSRLARLFGDNPSILIRCRYTGLRGRTLASFDSGRMFLDDRTCNDPEVSLGTQATATELDDNLAEVVHPLLVPLYERFAFFELPMRMVVEELEAMRRGRF